MKTTTMATMTAAQTELTELLVHHFDEHQRQLDIKDHAAEARAREIVSKVEELMTRQGLDNLGLKKNNNDNDDDDNDDDDDEASLETTLAATLTRFLDCAMASTDNTEDDSSLAVDAILCLCAAVAVRCSKPYPAVVNAVLQRTVKFSTVLLERVRCAACRCIGWIVSSLPSIPQKKKPNSLASLLDTASQALVPRFIDKSQAVRLAAITASGFFFSSGSSSKQDDNDDMCDDPDLRTSLTWALQHDASVVNRIAALHCLPVTVQTMDVILSRLRDVKRKVRLAALQVLTNKANFMTMLDASQCAGIVQAGMTDRDEEVQNETVKLICTSWMKTAKFNPITIMKHLNVVEYEDACEKVIQVLLDADDEMLAEHLSDPEIRAHWQGIETATTPVVVVDANNNKPSTQLLDVNMVFFARARCQYVKDTNKRARNVTTTRQAEAILSKVLPDIPVLCEIFERHSAALIKAVVAGGQEEDDNDSDMDDDENNNNNRRSSSLSSSLENAEKNQDSLTLTCLQLLQMACMSSSEMEEGSRLHLKQAMTNMLGSIITPDDVVEGCMVTLQAIHNVNGGEVDFCRCVSDIIHQLQRDAEVAVSSGDDGLNDNRLLRILSILSILFEKVSSVCPSIVADLATVIVPAARCETNELVREAAVSSFGKLGLFTPEQTVLRDFKPLLLKIVSNEDETLEIRAQAMLALCDWSILFSDTLGPCPVVADGDDDNDDSTPLVVTFPDLVFAMMAHDELGMVCVAAEVACKLLITGKICDSSWLARLVTLFFDVRLNDDDEVMEDDDNDCNQPDAAAASEVGSPVRLQQLLSLFFPAYSHKSEQNRHGLVGALSMILDSLLALHSQKRRRGAKSPVSVSKVLDYVVDTVFAADQTVQENLANKALEPGSQQQKESTVSSQLSTPVLMAAIQMASFLSKEHSNCKVVFLRTICKHLGSTAVVNLQVEREKDRDLSVLMDLMEELSSEITDATCLKSLALLNEVLDTIELDDDDEKVDGDKKEEDASSQDDGAESIVDAMQTMAISPATNRLDKENQSKDSGPRGGASTSSSGGNRGGGGSSERQRLSNSNEGGVLGSSYQSEDSSPRGGASTSSSGGGKHRTGKIERQRRKRLSNSNEGGVLGSC